MKKSNHITIIGAGLAGSLLAIYLAKRDFAVDVYEARGDMRKQRMSAGRSINMALSDRGIAALREVGMDDYMLREAIPMHGRMIHTVAGETSIQPYSGRKGEYINSISRGGLNIALMNAAEKYDNVTFHFGRRCIELDIETGDAIMEDGERISAETVIAADGAGSGVRQSMERQISTFDSSSVFLDHGYKELHIPPGNSSGDSRFLIAKNALHIWPRRQFMMIALPNLDGSFTCTLFLSLKGGENADCFENLTTPSAVLEFFEREFPDVPPLMPSLTDDFFANPTGALGTVKCGPWNVDGRVLLVGDAAHAMVPFYGQGMNCAFEDVRVLAGLIDEQNAVNPDWRMVYEEYGRLRRSNANAIQDMAVDNFYEMRDRVADPVFQRKRRLETRLEQTFPDYFSKYSMVTFREDLPYEEAEKRGNAQDELLMRICANADPDEMNLDETMELIRAL